MSSGRDEKGESRTTAAILVGVAFGRGCEEGEGVEHLAAADAAASRASAEAASSAATAPIDLPQIAILHPGPLSLTKKSTKSAKSSASLAPRETWSPSERPEPEKSRAATAIPAGRSRPITSSASLLEPELQWA